MDISEQTKAEIEEQKRIEYQEWNKKINDIAKEIIDILSDKQLSLRDFNEVLRIINQVVGTSVGEVNINFIINKKNNN